MSCKFVLVFIFTRQTRVFIQNEAECNTSSITTLFRGEYCEYRVLLYTNRHTRVDEESTITMHGLAISQRIVIVNAFFVNSGVHICVE